MIVFLFKLVVGIVEKVIEFFAPKIVVKEIAAVAQVVKKKPVRKTRSKKKVPQRKKRAV